MFKKLLLGAVLLISVNAFAQSKPEAGASKETSRKAEQLNLAGDLVNYGYEKQDALALIQAIKIYQDLNVIEATDGQKPIEKIEEGDNRGAGTIVKDDQPVRNEKQLLEDAAKFAKDDKNLLALVDECRNAKRSPVDGIIDRFFRIPSRGTHDWTVRLQAYQTTVIAISGDGTTDLDLYVYDQYGNLIVSDVSYGDQCYVALDVYITSNFLVRVVNRGYVYNDYEILIF